MINLFSWVEAYHYVQDKVLSLTNSQINTILWIEFTDVNYMSKNDRRIYDLFEAWN